MPDQFTDQAPPMRKVPVYDRNPTELPPRPEVGHSIDKPVAIQSRKIRDADGNYNDAALLQRATEIYEQSTSYLTTNILNDWERNLAHFHGEHAPNSKYRNMEIKRSRIFRPKTRASVKQQEAGLATAMFSSTNLVDLSPQNPADENQIQAASVVKELLQYRLDQRMRWPVTVQGAFQDTKVYGICISHQYWSFRDRVRHIPIFDEQGAPAVDEEGYELAAEETDILEDELRCDLVPPENFRFDPMCDWRNPADTSPFIIMIKPMRVIDVENMMQRNGGSWRDYSMEAITSAGSLDGDRVRYAREGFDRTDPADDIAVKGLHTVWAHFNIIREEGEDYVYWTLGTELLLTTPQPLREVEPWLRAGERPFVVGFSSIEAHKRYPAGDVQQSNGLQQEINEVANLRSDNVRLALNKRYHVRRGAQINIGALIRNVPGSVVLTDNPDADIKEVEVKDVTASSYREQELLAQELDQLVGGFDATRVAQEGASPGGLARAGAVASAVQDYGVWVFVETWVQPVLQQLMRLEQKYELDETILSIAAEKSGVLQQAQQTNQPIDFDTLLSQELNLKVDASIGTLDPLRKMDRLNIGISTVMNLPGMPDRINPMAVANEIFSALGWKSAERFFLSEEEYQAKLEANPPGPTEMEVKMRELDIRQEDNQMRNEREHLKLQLEDVKAELQNNFNEQAKILDRITKLEELGSKNQLQHSIAAAQDKTTRDKAALDHAAKMKELEIKEKELAKKSKEGSS